MRRIKDEQKLIEELEYHMERGNSYLGEVGSRLLDNMPFHFRDSLLEYCMGLMAYRIYKSHTESPKRRKKGNIIYPKQWKVR